MTLMFAERKAKKETIEPALHTLRATPETCHWGYFDAARAPALRVRSGDMIRAEAVTHHAGDAPELLMDEGITAIYEGIPESDRNPGVHVMTGPIHVEGAPSGLESLSAIRSSSSFLRARCLDALVWLRPAILRPPQVRRGAMAATSTTMKSAKGPVTTRTCSP